MFNVQIIWSMNSHLNNIIVYFRFKVQVTHLIQCVAQTSAVDSTQVQDENRTFKGTSITNAEFRNSLNVFIVQKSLRVKMIVEDILFVFIKRF